MQAIALISDIHANLEALEAVLRDIHHRGIKEIICLGDLVGYGPDPRKVIKIAKDFMLTLRGNHEDAVLFSSYDFTPDAVKAIEWTRSELNSSRYPKEENHALWDFLGSLKTSLRLEDVIYVHASPRNHTKEYIMPHDIYDRELMMEFFSMIPRLCFVGHTHIPGLFTEGCVFLPPKYFSRRFRLERGKKYIINIGSVGQPRDGDAQACYVIFEGDLVRYHRVPYNFKITMKKIKETQGIPARFADRLELGR
jgi:predicted phosphodiesterase